MAKNQKSNTKYFKIDYYSDSKSYKVYVRAIYEDASSNMPSYKTEWCEVETDISAMLSDADKALDSKEGA